MVALVKNNLEAINALCREYGVLRLELFGSAATGAFDPERDDVDFLATYPDDYDFGPWAGRYTGLWEALGALFPCPTLLYTPRSQAMESRYFVEYLNETRQVLYAANDDSTPTSRLERVSQPSDS